MDAHSKIYVAGHRGLVGSAIVRQLRARGHGNLVTRTHSELDLVDQAAVERFFADERPEFVILAAAKVGGIHANSHYPAEFIQDNLAIQTNVIHSAWRNGARKFVFLGSSCIYPRNCPQPIREEYLLSGPLEPTNEAYAIAKIAGIKMCQAYRRQYGFDAVSVMPTNLYGIGDNYHPENSHVLPAMIRRFDEAYRRSDPEVRIWGSGTPRREFLFSDDLADGVLAVMDRYSDEDIVNVGTGEDITILELAQLVADVVGYQGSIHTDPSKPDGTPRKVLDVSKIKALGWSPSTTMRAGIELAYKDYLENHVGGH